MIEWEMDYRVWVRSETLEEAEEIIDKLLRKAFKDSTIHDWDGPIEYRMIVVDKV